MKAEKTESTCNLQHVDDSDYLWKYVFRYARGLVSTETQSRLLGALSVVITATVIGAESRKASLPLGKTRLLYLMFLNSDACTSQLKASELQNPQMLEAATSGYKLIPVCFFFLLCKYLISLLRRLSLTSIQMQHGALLRNRSL